MPLRYNDEIVELAAGPPVAGVTDERWEVEGDASAEYRTTELDQTSPAGLFRIRGQSDQWLVQRAAGSVDDPWSSAVTILTFDGATGLVLARTAAGLTAGTTQTQAGGFVLVAEVNEVSTVANVNDTVVLPAAAPGLRIVIINNGANTLRIYPASGDDLGQGVDTFTSLAAGSNVVFVAYDATTWEII
ncbi:MAG: hypothetical protein IIA44_08105 [Acidobacteria bacterium]|nr:hypothetical protein [Acidobacteriota bacterium]